MYKLSQDGITPHIFGEEGAVAPPSAWSLDVLQNFMQGCDGVAVLGLIRHQGGHVAEYNHIEGALALAYRIPLFLIHEEGAVNRGILDPQQTSSYTVMIHTPAIPVNAPSGWFNTDAQFNADYNNWRSHL
ncbi:MAG: hypothetical protein SH821_07380 [Phototrophicales bacterium]|nr:hypothetical protein [Phototrophicales bacterium]